ncbi:MAG: DNRLRE domain-containing protein, partial [Chloroflexota bacterium]|nr:DNRLRE domain-containing protein [Chloroflexota bacterium]
MRRGAWQVGWLVALLAIMLGVVGVAVAQPPTESGREEVEIVAEQDTYIASGQPDTNFGGSDALFIGYVIGTEEYGATRTLLQFDVASALPENATVERVRLILYLRYAEPPSDTLMETRVRRLDSAWGEFAVTWNSEPTWDAKLAPVMADVGSDQGPYEWDLTEMVRSWVTDEHPNYGLLLQGDETPELARERVFFSRDATVGDELKPRLIVEYVVDEVPPVVTVNPLPA